LSGAGSCNVTIDRLTQDNGMFVVALIQGSVCDGEELLCEELDGSATSYTVSFSTIGTYRNGDYVLMVQNASTMMQTQTFEITSDCY